MPPRKQARWACDRVSKEPSLLLVRAVAFFTHVITSALESVVGSFEARPDGGARAISRASRSPYRKQPSWLKYQGSAAPRRRAR
jgi:hypothetical protein